MPVSRGPLPYAHLRFNSNQSIANNTATTLSTQWNQTVQDVRGMASSGRITCPFAGVVLATAYVSWDVGATGYRSAVFLLSGAVSLGGEAKLPAGASVNTLHSISTTMPVVAGDYWDVQVYQNNGGNLNMLIGSRFTLAYLDVA